MNDRKGDTHMSTTKLYVEYIVVGLETLFWVAMVPVIILGEPAVEFIRYCTTNAFPAIILIGVCYILGIEMDRFSDAMLKRYCNQVKINYNMDNKTSIAIWERYSKNNFAPLTLSRIRILRSTAFNGIAILVASVILIAYRYYNLPLLICNIVFWIFLIVWSFMAHNHLVDNYYKKLKELETQSDESMTSPPDDI